MSESILYVDTSEIREGKLEELRTAMNELVEFIETNEPGVIAYNVYLNEDGNQMTVVHVHSDSASLEFHMLVAGPLFPKFAAFIKLLRIDRAIYLTQPTQDVEVSSVRGLSAHFD